MLNYNDIQNAVGKRIAECRKLRGLRQIDLAEKLGKSMRSVQEYESGKIDIPISVIAKIAKALDVSVNYLVGYQSSHLTMESLSDVIALILELNKKNEIKFDVQVEKSDLDDWKCSLVFDGKSPNALYNADFCLFLERLKDNLCAMNEYWLDWSMFNVWGGSEVDSYKKSFLTEKPQELLTRDELIEKRNQMYNDKFQKMYKEMKSNDKK